MLEGGLRIFLGQQSSKPNGVTLVTLAMYTTSAVMTEGKGNGQVRGFQN